MYCDSNFGGWGGGGGGTYGLRFIRFMVQSTKVTQGVLGGVEAKKEKEITESKFRFKVRLFQLVVLLQQ